MSLIYFDFAKTRLFITNGILLLKNKPVKRENRKRKESTDLGVTLSIIIHGVSEKPSKIPSETFDYTDLKRLHRLHRRVFNLGNPCLPAGRCFLIGVIIKKDFFKSFLHNS
jgi:hypothetical protein